MFIRSKQVSPGKSQEVLPPQKRIQRLQNEAMKQIAFSNQNVLTMGPTNIDLSSLKSNTKEEAENREEGLDVLTLDKDVMKP